MPRWSAVVLLGLVTACSSAGISSPGSSSPPASVDAVGQTTTSSATPPNATGGTGVPNEQDYTVVAGDYIVKIAKLYNVQPNDLVTYNAWPEGLDHKLHPGEAVKIPPGASPPRTTTPSDSAPPTTTGKTTTTIAGGACAKGTYTIEEGDYPGLVATKFDATLDELNAANANTKGYSMFFVGLKIVIPAKKNC